MQLTVEALFPGFVSSSEVFVSRWVPIGDQGRAALLMVKDQRALAIQLWPPGIRLL
jgi:hypothetical protein